jgi:hypothetical protein
MTRKLDPTKLLIRNLCKQGIDKNPQEFTLRRLRAETSIVDSLTFQIKIFGEGNPIPAYYTVTVKQALT